MDLKFKPGTMVFVAYGDGFFKLGIVDKKVNDLQFLVFDILTKTLYPVNRGRLKTITDIKKNFAIGKTQYSHNKDKYSKCPFVNRKEVNN